MQLEVTIDNKEPVLNKEIDIKSFYDQLRNGANAKTSAVTLGYFEEHMRASQANRIYPNRNRYSEQSLRAKKDQSFHSTTIAKTRTRQADTRRTQTKRHAQVAEAKRKRLAR